MLNKAFVLSVCGAVAVSCDSPDIDTSRDAFPNGAIITPENRVDPGGERIVGAPGDDPRALAGAWVLASEDGSSCTIVLRELRDGRGGAQPQACAGAWARIASWRIGPPPVGTRSIVLMDEAGARIWGGAGLADGSYRGQDVNGAMAALARP